MDQHIDYSTYSYTDLLSAKAGIDAQTYPDRAAEIQARLDRHPDNPANQQHQHHAANGRLQPVLFHGKTAEYFAIWIVNLLLTIVTLGIFSAWATVRTQRYFYSNTEIDGHRLNYLAKPLQILKGRIIGVLLFAIYLLASTFSPLAAVVIMLLLLLATPWLICMSIRFRMRVSAYRNIKFDFSGRYGQAFVVFIGLPILSVFTLYLLMPWVLKKIDQFIYTNISYGNRKMQLNLSTGQYYAASFGALMIGIVLLLLTGVAFGVSMSDFTQDAGFSASFILFMLGYVLTILLCGSFYTARIRNHVFNSMQLDQVAQFHSELSVLQLAWLRFSNFIALICSLGFAMPWVKIRTARVFANATQLTIFPGADEVIGDASQSVSAVGEEVANVFDIDVALG